MTAIQLTEKVLVGSFLPNGVQVDTVDDYQPYEPQIGIRDAYVVVTGGDELPYTVFFSGEVQNDDGVVLGNVGVWVDTGEE